MRLNLNPGILSRLNFLIIFVLMTNGLNFSGISFALGAESIPTIGHLKVFEDEFYELVPEDAVIEVLGSGFDWSEGPLWIPDGGYLIFSDIPRNSIMKWSQREGISLFMKPSGYTGLGSYSREPGSNGLALDHEGRIIFCEHGDRRVSRLERNGGKKTLADSYNGKRFNSPNDVVVKSNGDIYFTDPPYGLPERFKDKSRELDYCGVFRISKEGEVTLLTKEMTAPNGIAFSPNEKILYVAQSDSRNPVIKAFAVRANGTLGPGEVFFDFSDTMGKMPGGPDGLKVDRAGNVFATGPGGVYVITLKGKALGRIHTGQHTANCAWGGADSSVLYMTADSYLCRIQTKTKGNVITIKNTMR